MRNINVTPPRTRPVSSAAGRQRGNSARRQPARRGSGGNPLKTMFFVLVVLAVLFVGTVVANIIVGANNADVDEKYVFNQSIYIDGISITGMTKAEAEAALQQAEQTMLFSTTVAYEVNGQEKSLLVGQLGCTSNLQDLFRTAKRFNGNADSVKDIENAVVEGKNLKLTLKPVFDLSTVYNKLIGMSDNINVEPKDASIIFDADSMSLFEYVPETKGFDVDMADLAKQLVEKYETQEKVVATGKEVPAHHTLADVRANTVKISSYTTKFSHKATTNRGFNIKKMAEIINGQELKPGEVWSINEVAGDRTTANGWKDAAGIERGVYVDVPGGGICQVSTTLFNAAIRAELELVEHKRHSWPSEYAPIGMDATISTGSPDLKLLNPYEMPVYIVAWVNDEERTVTVELYGAPLSHGYTIDFVSKIIKTRYPGAADIQSREKDPNGKELKLGESKLIREAKMGITADIYKQYIDPTDGHVVATYMLYEANYAPKAAVYYENPNQPTADAVAASN